MASIKARVGYYDVIETLGSGSFGKVKLAYHIITGHKVALKFINKDKVSKEKGMPQRIAREIEYLRFLRHPHIIKLYEVLHTPKDLVMVMEYAGDELFQYISERGRMSEIEALRFLQQLVSAVEYCHRHFIVHRDLKPENLLLDKSKNLKVADFGLSNCLTDGDFLKTSCGSPNYAAPEVILGKLYAGPEVDVWSIGVILYVLLVGRLPFEDEYIPTLFHKISTAQYTIPTFISSGARSLISAMLVVDPIKRITIPQLRSHAFFNQNLPPYLNAFPGVPPSPTDDADDQVPLDDSIIAHLVEKLHMSSSSIVSRLVVTDAGSASTDPVRVAYMLCLDNKHLWAAGTKRSDDAFINTQWVVSSTPPSTHPITSPGTSVSSTAASFQKHALGPTTQSSYIPQLLDLLDNSSISLFQRPQLELTPPVQTTSKKSRSKWHVGIRSRSNPIDVMLELYKAVLAVGMECKPLGPFALRARYTCPASTKVPHSPMDGLLLEPGSKPSTPPADVCVVKLDLQLYKVDTDYYLVDFKLVLPPPSNTDEFLSAPPVPPVAAKSLSADLSKPPVSSLLGRSSPGSGGVASFRRRSSSMSMRAAALNGGSAAGSSADARIVSPYAFLDCAVRIIAELASSG